MVTTNITVNAYECYKQVESYLSRAEKKRLVDSMRAYIQAVYTEETVGGYYFYWEKLIFLVAHEDATFEEILHTLNHEMLHDVIAEFVSYYHTATLDRLLGKVYNFYRNHFTHSDAKMIQRTLFPGT